MPGERTMIVRRSHEPIAIAWPTFLTMARRRGQDDVGRDERTVSGAGSITAARGYLGFANPAGRHSSDAATIDVCQGLCASE
jgi:hypothetical protein